MEVVVAAAAAVAFDEIKCALVFKLNRQINNTKVTLPHPKKAPLSLYEGTCN